MKDWIKTHKDALILTGCATAATAVVVGVTHVLTRNTYIALNDLNRMQMAIIASDAGVLDKIIAHQDNLKNIM